jgi:threonine dehydrogenase-like Zn-dependent dehydrogenase
MRTAQQHGQRYVPRLLEHIERGELSTADLATHTLPLEDGPRGYEMFKEKQDGCLRVVFTP